MEYTLEVIRGVEAIVGNGNALLVGGAVRDIVMGSPAKDYDFCGPLKPEDVEKLCKNAGRRVYKIGARYGTTGFKVNTSKGYVFCEYTTYRQENYSAGSRKPDVVYVDNLDDELNRRDFTMNAMVLKSDGKIYDPFGGKLDIHAKQIKTVGLPKDRIQEDPLRMLRAARFAARYDFKIDPNFIGKARQLADRIYDVSVERWVQELDKLLISNHRYVGMAALESMAILDRVLPELGGYEMTYDNDFQPSDAKEYESTHMAWRDLLKLVNENPKTARYVAGGICHRLKFSNQRTKIVLDKLKP